MEKINKECNCERKKHRDEKEKKLLVNRLNRIAGQVDAVGRMIEEDAYCPDILLQISAAESALCALRAIMLREHINTCVLSDIKMGKEGAADELANLIQRMSKG